MPKDVYSSTLYVLQYGKLEFTAVPPYNCSSSSASAHAIFAEHRGTTKNARFSVETDSQLKPVLSRKVRSLPICAPRAGAHELECIAHLRSPVVLHSTFNCASARSVLAVVESLFPAAATRRHGRVPSRTLMKPVERSTVPETARSSAGRRARGRV